VRLRKQSLVVIHLPKERPIVLEKSTHFADVLKLGILPPGRGSAKHFLFFLRNGLTDAGMDSVL
jgi:hypothetical protein